MDPGLCRPSRRVRIQHWKRDPCVDRALAWEAAGREVHRAALSHREGGRPRRPRDLRELSVDGIPAAPVPRLLVVQRVPGIPTVARGLPRATAQPERRSPGVAQRNRTGQPPKRRGDAGCDVVGPGPGCLPCRLCGGHRLRLDRRVVSREIPGRRLGVRVDDAGSDGQACVASRVPGVRRIPVLPRPSLAKDSVVVSTLNGAATLRDTLAGLEQLDYPDYEVIVVNDGSTDATPQIASEYHVRLITTKNQGLSAARNVGTRAATGEIVAFIDDDAYPEIHWLRFLALAFMEGKYVGVGGPNLPPPNDGWIADAGAHGPGGPDPLRLSATVAEHNPGCNMAFRKDALEAIGGFDPVFRTAGDDVDVCWRLRDRGGLIGYSPAAVVWHHRRKSSRRFWEQQVGYGKAEALLEHKWPARYNSIGQLSWRGRLYGRGVSLDFSAMRGRVYHGVWGTAPFQSLYGSRNSRWSLALAPEWYLMIGLVAG